METNELIDLGKSCSFQLLLLEKIYERKLDVLGKFIKANGVIFVGHVGYHKTKALLEVSSPEVM